MIAVAARYQILLFTALAVSAAENTPEQLEFFHKKIRPVLARKCYQCHSDKIATPMGGLRVDSRDALLAGGDTGPVIAPG